MKKIDVLTAVLIVVGGVNWGLVGWLNFDLVAAIFGEMSLLSRAVYALVGVAAIYQLMQWGAMRRRWVTAAAVASLILAPGAATAQGNSEKPMKNIVQVAVDAGSFNTLVTAVKAADLVGTLSGPGPFTVFAPSDAAFAKLPAGTIDALLKDKSQLSSVLTFHVIAGRIDAASIIKMKGATPTTVNGQPLDIQVRAGKVYVNGAEVITADVSASNGVIHVIDAVLLPRVPAGAAR